MQKKNEKRTKKTTNKYALLVVKNYLQIILQDLNNKQQKHVRIVENKIKYTPIIKTGTIHKNQELYSMYTKSFPISGKNGDKEKLLGRTTIVNVSLKQADGQAH